jgi:hypothetical protein
MKFAQNRLHIRIRYYICFSSAVWPELLHSMLQIRVWPPSVRSPQWILLWPALSIVPPHGDENIIRQQIIQIKFGSLSWLSSSSSPARLTSRRPASTSDRIRLSYCRADLGIYRGPSK